MKKMITVLLVSSFCLGTALAQETANTENQPNKTTIKFEIPKEDLQILKLKKLKELWDLKANIEQMKNAYEINKYLFKKEKTKALRNYNAEIRKLKILKTYGKINPSLSIPVKGIIGDIAITDNIAMKEGSQIYTYKVEKITNTNMIVNGQGLNIFFAMKDKVSDEFLNQILQEENVEIPEVKSDGSVIPVDSNVMSEVNALVPYKATPVGGE